jgi:O-antigen/teichoic acid export membrane protein
MADGAVWLIAARLLDRGLGLLSTLILARLLVPADFGLIAMATSILALLEALTSFGLDAALIRHRGAHREHFDTVWTLYVLLGALIGAALLVAAIPAADFFDEPRLAPILAALAAIAFVRGFENVGMLALERELAFRRVFAFIAVKKAAAFCTGVFLALALRDYRALLGGMAAGALTGVALSYALHSYRPRPSLACWRELFSFSKWLLIKNVLDFFRLRYADLVIGRVAGPTAVGVYSVGAEIALLPTTELVAPINRAVLPGYAQMAREREVLRQGYVAVLGLVAVVALPAALGIAAIAPVLIPALLGQHWSAAVEVVQVLALVGALQALLSNAYPVYLALDKPWIATALSAAHAVLLAVALPALGLWWGLRGVMFGVLAVNIVLFPIGLATTLRLLRLPFAGFLAVLLRPLMASALMYLVVTQYIRWLHTQGGALALGAAIGVGIICYATALAALWWIRGRPEGAESAILLRLRSWIPGTRYERSK